LREENSPREEEGVGRAVEEVERITRPQWRKTGDELLWKETTTIRGAEAGAEDGAMSVAGADEEVK